MHESGFSLTVDLPDVDHEEATRRVVERLDQEGFGILTEIDVKETLKKKLNVEYPRYVILGAGEQSGETIDCYVDQQKGPPGTPAEPAVDESGQDVGAS